MNINKLLIILAILISQTGAITVKDFFKYLDPVPGANYVKKQSNIIISFKHEVNKNNLFSENAIKITGSSGNRYSYQIFATGEKDKYLIKTINEFTPGEKITVTFSNNIRYSDGSTLKTVSYEFNISNSEVNQNSLTGLENEIPLSLLKKLLEQPHQENDFPEAFPVITVNFSDNPAPGNILISNLVFNVQVPNTPHLIIMKNDATPVFSRQMGGQIFDFNRQPNGNFTYFSRVRGKYYELDTEYVLRDSFYTGNGYLTDLHELRVLPNRHALLMSYDKQVVDMSMLIPGGNPAALVTGLIIQEIDEFKNVVFQWRSWDHIPITDATHENLLAPEIDYIHGNAIELDNDGNLMISSRHLDEITKINRTTGNIIWRLGGKKNEFVFSNDPLRFSYQHGIRRLTNGNIILYDNGNYHTPQQSRAVEYTLDEQQKIVTKVWEYKNTPVIYGYAMGFAQRLENGNTLISWGATNPTLTEVRSDGSKALQISLPQNVFTYRAFKYQWNTSVTGIEPVNNLIPSGYKLYQNYPNPFNPETYISFSIPAFIGKTSSFVKLSVYSILGNEIAALVNEELKAGNYKVKFNSAGFASGTYFYKLTSGSFTDTKKMVLIK